MRDYGKVHSTFWTSQTTRGMSEDARTLALYLLTCPHSTIAGVFRLPDGYACEDLQWVPERVAEGFRELFEKGFANRCETTKWVWICKHLEWNPPENPNQRKAINKVAAQVPNECYWKQEFISTLDPENINPSETLSKPFRNQEQEQEQEQEEKLRPRSKAARLPAKWVLPKAWGEWALAEKPDWTPEAVRAAAASFADFWHAKGGRDACKLDWEATWRNWVRREPDKPKKSALAEDVYA